MAWLGGECHGVDVARLFDLQRVCHRRLVLRKGYHVDKTHDLADDKNVVPGVDQGGDVWLLDGDLADLLILLGLVDHNETSIARQRDPFGHSLGRNLIHGETLLDKDLDDVVGRGVVNGHHANGRAHDERLVVDGSQEVNLSLHLIKCNRHRVRDQRLVLVVLTHLHH